MFQTLNTYDDDIISVFWSFVGGFMSKKLKKCTFKGSFQKNITSNMDFPYKFGENFEENIDICFS